MIFEKGEKTSPDYFTGTVWANMLVTDKENIYNTQTYNVTFAPGARTHWHSHPGGQILLITKGAGYYQEKGKPARLLKPGGTVEIALDVVHWHGAAPDSDFIHIGISANNGKGPAKWLGPVTDSEYNGAVK